MQFIAMPWGLPDLISRPRKASNSSGTGPSEAPESSSETVEVAVVSGVPDAEQHVDEHDDADGHGVADYGVPGRAAIVGVARVWGTAFLSQGPPHCS